MVSKRYEQMHDKITAQTEKMSPMMSPKNYNPGKRKTQNDLKFEKSVNDFMKLRVFIFFFK